MLMTWRPQVHWGHPGNMAVVLFAMGGYGAGYLGWCAAAPSDCCCRSAASVICTPCCSQP